MNQLLFQMFRIVWVIPVIILLSCSKKLDTNPSLIDLRIDTSILIEKDTAAIKSYLALGDSYTIGQSVSVKDRFPVQAVNSLRAAGYNVKEAEIIATSGWTTGNLLSAIKNKTNSPVYDIITLLIGVNNQYRGGSIEEYIAEFTALLQKSIQFAGDRPERVIVLSIPDYSVTPFATSSDRDKIAREIDAFNVVNKLLAEAYKVNYINVTEESRKAASDPSLIAYDGLHFSGKEYTIWAGQMVPVIKQILK